MNMTTSSYGPKVSHIPKTPTPTPNELLKAITYSDNVTNVKEQVILRVTM